MSPLRRGLVALPLLASLALAGNADAKAPCQLSVKAPRGADGVVSASGRARCARRSTGSGTLTLILVRDSGDVDRKVRKLRGPFGPATPSRKVKLACDAPAGDDPVVQVGTELMIRAGAGRRAYSKDSRLVDWTAVCPPTGS